MKKYFTMDKFISCEVTGGTELAEYICRNYERVPDDTNDKHDIKRFIIPLIDWEDDVIDSDFAFIEKDIRECHSVELWILWTEKDGELNEWWIAGDNT